MHFNLCILLMISILSHPTSSIFFPTLGGGSSSCCCGCGTPQSSYCGCCQPQPACPVCQPCAPASSCQPQIVYAQSPCSSGCGGSSYASPLSYSSPPMSYLPPLAPPSSYSAPVQTQVALSSYQPTFSASSYGASAPLPPPPPANTQPYNRLPPAPGYQNDDVLQSSSSLSNTDKLINEPTSTRVFRQPQNCENQPMKYIFLRKRGDSYPNDLSMEEVEQVPVDARSQLTEHLSDNDQFEFARAMIHFDDPRNSKDNELQNEMNSKCNSIELMNLIIKHVVKEDAIATKRAIHEAAMNELPGYNIDIICSTTGFTYLVSTTEHCEAQRDNVICFIYRRNAE